MNRYSNLLFLVVVLVIMASMFFEETEGGFRKPPMNGSIFGKRSSSSPSLSLNAKGKSLTLISSSVSDIPGFTLFLKFSHKIPSVTTKVPVVVIKA